MTRPRIQAALVVGVGLAVCLYDPAAPAVWPKRVALALLAVVALVVGRPRVNAASAAWLMFVGWSLTSLWWSDQRTLGHAGPWLAASGLALTLEPRTVRRIAPWLAALVILIHGGAAAWQQLGGASGIGVHGVAGNPSWLGLVVAAWLPLLVDGMWRHDTGPRWQRALLGVALLAGLGALLLSRSLTSWLALLIALAVWWGPRGIPLIVLTMFGLLVFGFQLFETRLWLWRCSIDAMANAPLVGSGHGSFASSFLEAQGARLSSLPLETAALRFDNALHAHCDWLTSGVESGVVGGMLLALALLFCHHQRTDWKGGRASVVVIAVSALGDAPLQQPGVVAVLALLLCCGPAPDRDESLAARAALSVACGIALAVASLGWWSSRQLVHAQLATPGERLAILERAAGIDRVSARAPALSLALGVAQHELGQSGVEALEVAAKSPSLGADVALGNALLAQGDTSRAIAAYRRALQRHPGHFRALLNLAQALRQAGDLDAAAASLERAHELQPNHPKLRQLDEQIRRERIDAATR